MKKILLYPLFLLTAVAGFAQQSKISIGSAGYFNFPNGPKEWSEPKQVTLQSAQMEKKGIEAVPVSVRLRVKKKFVLACHYEVELTNLSDSRNVQFAYYNKYTQLAPATAGNGYRSEAHILHKVKLKPKAVTVDKIVFAELGFKPKNEDHCLECTWDIMVTDIKAK